MRCVKAILAAAMLGASLPAMALPEDSEQPIRIQADTARLDERRNVAVYTGDVIITQGSMRLTGQEVTLTTDADGAVTKVVSKGSPATFVQTPQPGQTPVNGRGRTIEYHATDETVVMIDNAHLEQDGNTFQGDYVSYDVARQVVDAGRTAGAQGTGQQRIEMVIQPRRRNEPATNE
ncbi:lipopolysaccharide export system protein LptA [Halopseudomonas xinjiangensis]|uniref:Lipopolysaccharide export system protein LptA n=1 Tax=Halopseudomonas xinjiangensis TaxID=487184 RepID=A0A1H1VPU9_9GAMM|nr:lipopolysaccharide transport periplasmic protein LptA [Halopseudomonas xinjiangensis]SDS86089.1 lipopolysaccharide export system protein LptA [Halopseudomonas xinjiangensis]